MASRTLTDRGVDAATITFEKRPSGLVVEVRVAVDDGVPRVVLLGVAELGASLTTSERAALPGVLAKLYAAALAAAGFAG